MSRRETAKLRNLPSVDELLKEPSLDAPREQYGRAAVVSAIRKILAKTRAQDGKSPGDVPPAGEIALRVQIALEQGAAPNLRPVFNLTGTIIHTNLGRSVLAEAAIEAATIAMRSAVTLEFDLAGGKRGERDDHLRGLLCELTGAEDATVVNNNAAAVLLVLNTLARGQQAIVSRGELIEIGGAFRMPEIMSRAGCKLVEIGTTNRTHMKDYTAAINKKTGLLLKVHTSNYRIEGFSKEVKAKELAALAKKNKVPLVNDLGSGTLVDLSKFGIAHEPTVAEAVAEGADLVTFSGDKLLGGPQAGFIVGKKKWIELLNKNPMKRALRVDKIRLAALEATLKLYRDPERLAERLPTLKAMSRKPADIEPTARQIADLLSARVGDAFVVEVADCKSQIGSGSLPLETLKSKAVVLRPREKRGGSALERLVAAFRALPIPVIGRVENKAVVLDMRCLTDVEAFVRNLNQFKAGDGHELA